MEDVEIINQYGMDEFKNTLHNLVSIAKSFKHIWSHCDKYNVQRSFGNGAERLRIAVIIPITIEKVYKYKFRD